MNEAQVHLVAPNDPDPRFRYLARNDTHYAYGATGEEALSDLVGISQDDPFDIFDLDHTGKPIR